MYPQGMHWYFSTLTSFFPYICRCGRRAHAVFYIVIISVCHQLVVIEGLGPDHLPDKERVRTEVKGVYDLRLKVRHGVFQHYRRAGLPCGVLHPLELVYLPARLETEGADELHRRVP